LYLQWEAYNGSQFPKIRKEAGGYLEKAAERGHAEANYQLALKYLGYNKVDIAMQHMDKAADLGFEVPASIRPQATERLAKSQRGKKEKQKLLEMRKRQAEFDREKRLEKQRELARIVIPDITNQILNGALHDRLVTSSGVADSAMNTALRLPGGSAVRAISVTSQIVTRWAA